MECLVGPYFQYCIGFIRTHISGFSGAHTILHGAAVLSLRAQLGCGVTPAEKVCTFGLNGNIIGAQKPTT